VFFLVGEPVALEIEEHLKIRLNEEGVAPSLHPDRRLWCDPVVVSGKDTGLIGEGEELLAQRIVFGSRSSTKICSSYLADEESVAGEERIADVKADRIRGVAGCVDDLHLKLAEWERGSILHANACLRIGITVEKRSCPGQSFDRGVSVRVIEVVVGDEDVDDLVPLLASKIDDPLRRERRVDHEGLLACRIGDEVTEVAITASPKLLDKHLPPSAPRLSPNND